MTHRLSIEEIRQRLTDLRDNQAEVIDELDHIIAELEADAPEDNDDD